MIEERGGGRVGGRADWSWRKEVLGGGFERAASLVIGEGRSRIQAGWPQRAPRTHQSPSTNLRVLPHLPFLLLHSSPSPWPSSCSYLFSSFSSTSFFFLSSHRAWSHSYP